MIFLWTPISVFVGGCKFPTQSLRALHSTYQFSVIKEGLIRFAVNHYAIFDVSR